MTRPARPGPGGDRGGTGVVVLVVVLLVMLLAVGAGATAVVMGWAPEQPASQRDDPLVGHAYYADPAAVCGLLDPRDLQLALGRVYHEGSEPPLDYPVFAGMTGVVRCTYQAKGVSQPFSLGVVYAYAERIYQARLEQNRNTGEITEIPELGAKAVWSESPGELMALTGDKLVVVHLADTSGPEQARIERLRRLAGKAIGRLK